MLQRNHLYTILRHNSTRVATNVVNNKKPAIVEQNRIKYNQLLKPIIKDKLSYKRRIELTIIDLFLPKGYPNTVGLGYLRYSQWQIIHNVSSTVTGVLSTQSLLYAMGLGAGSIPMAAALNWIIKDGLGQLGGVIYVSIMGNKFDSNPKRHRMWSALAMQASCLVELFSPLVPGFFLLVASVSNIGKNISWLAASATRAQMNSSFALKDNLGDITGKSGSQSTLAAVVGTTLGVGISPILGQDIYNLILGFIPISYISLYSVYKANNYVITKNFDFQRLELVLKEYYQNKKLLDPKDVADKEQFMRMYKSNFDGKLIINPKLSTVKGIDLNNIIQQILKVGYSIHINDKKEYYLFFCHDITNYKIIEVFYILNYQRHFNKEYIKDSNEIDNFINQLIKLGWNLDTYALVDMSNSIKLIYD